MDRMQAAADSVAKVDKHWDAYIATQDATELRAAVAAAHEFVDNGGDPADTRAIREARRT
ncbi:hypothetical protein [Streptomyces collinus]|uniref:hypothetical protein n=1 Tax=Streptomyces collinus TaxID=42684 RepID=UPI0037F37334